MLWDNLGHSEGLVRVCFMFHESASCAVIDWFISTGQSVLKALPFTVMQTRTKGTDFMKYLSVVEVQYIGNIILGKFGAAFLYFVSKLLHHNTHLQRLRQCLDRKC